MRKWIIGMLIAGSLTGGGLYYVTRPKPGIPREVFQNMRFPKGATMTGDEANGWLCHEIRKWDPDKKEWMLWNLHTINRDFRQMTPGERMDAIINDTIADVGGLDLLACAQPSDWFPDSSPAYADPPKCGADCGGGCQTLTCPATNHPGGCTLNGNSCAMSFICCSTPCPTTCE